MAFAWWVETAGGNIDDTGLLNALDDVTWVVRCMADMLTMPSQLIGNKHAQEDNPDTSTTKRCVFSFLITSHADVVNVTGGKQSELKRRRNCRSRH